MLHSALSGDHSIDEEWAKVTESESKSLEIAKTDAVGGSVEHEIMKIVKVVKVVLLSVLQQRQQQ